MKSFAEVCEDTVAKLGRQLQEDEKDFLAWMFENYEKERKRNGKQCKSLQGQGV